MYKRQVSLYNDTKLPNNTVIPIHPTPVIGMVGLIDDINKICKKSWVKAEDQIWMIGLPLENNINQDKRISLSVILLSPLTIARAVW